MPDRARSPGAGRDDAQPHDDVASAGASAAGGAALLAPRDRAWALCAVVLLGALFAPILQIRGTQYWDDPRYSHCLLLPVVSALYVWDRWERVRALPRTPSRAGLVALAVAILGFLYGRALGANFAQHLALLLAAPAVVAAVFGTRWLRALAFPLGYMLLTIPLPRTWDERLTQPLQRTAAVIAEGSFDAFGWAVVRQGNVIQLPGLKLLVEEQCSGAHSLYALGALGVAWVAFVPRPLWLRCVLIGSTVPIALLANAVRVTATGVLAYKVDPSYATGVSHQTAGMIVFVIGLALFLLTDWCLRPDEVRDAAHADG